MAKYNVSLQAYEASFMQETGVSAEIEEDSSMDASSALEDLAYVSSAPPIPPRCTNHTTEKTNSNNNFTHKK